MRYGAPALILLCSLAATTAAVAAPPSLAALGGSALPINSALTAIAAVPGMSRRPGLYQGPAPARYFISADRSAHGIPANSLSRICTCDTL